MTWFEAPGLMLPDLVALHGKWRGARTALIEGERRLTWAEFERETARDRLPADRGSRRQMVEQHLGEAAAIIVAGAEKEHSFRRHRASCHQVSFPR